MLSPQATFFHTSDWLIPICETYKFGLYRLVAYEGDAPRGLLGLVEIKSRLFGHRLISIPFCEYGGPLFLGPSDARTFDCYSELHKAANKIKRERSAISLEYRIGADSLRHLLPLRLSISSKYLTFRISGETTRIWEQMDKKVRNVIRRSTGKGITIRRLETERELDEFYNLYARVQTRRGSPAHSKQLFQRLLRSKNTNISQARYEGRIISAIVTFLGPRMSNWWANVNDPQYKRLNATSLLLWYFLRQQAEETNGGFCFDLGRTRRDSGIYVFKDQWGGEKHALFHLSESDIDGARNSRLDPENLRFRVAASMWKILPLKVAKKIGPRIISGIGL
jgi:FemAB-related protein (PEP-CTERM system-associated)